MMPLDCLDLRRGVLDGPSRASNGSEVLDWIENTDPESNDR